MIATLHRVVHHRVKQFFFGNFTYLLVSLILLYALRPYHRSSEYLRVWEIWMAIVFLGAIFNCNHPNKVKIFAVVLGLPALVFDWMSIAQPVTPWIVLSFAFTGAFLFLCTFSLLYNEVLNSKPTLGSLRPIICAYFMLAYAFAFCYMIVEHFDPGSIQFINRDPAAIFITNRDLAEVIYFSFGNLTTAGASNMAALNNISQTITMLEIITGQLYIAILISRVIALYSGVQGSKKNRFL